MQITLNQDEILVAIQSYVHTQINISDDQEISVDLKAGRGENGFTATLDIAPTGEPKEAAPAPKKLAAVADTPVSTKKLNLKPAPKVEDEAPEEEEVIDEGLQEEDEAPAAEMPSPKSIFSPKNKASA